MAAIAWSALALQFVLLIRATWHGKGPLLATIQFFSYFTILSNVLVALVATFAPARADGAIASFFRSPRVRGAAALFIAVTGCVYVTVLRSIWAPSGLQWLADVGLHYASPSLYLTLWLVFAPRRSLEWIDALRWIAFPGIYLVWILVRGAWLHEYPYPFLDVAALGIARVLVNAAVVALVFIAIGLVLVAYNRLRVPVHTQ